VNERGDGRTRTFSKWITRARQYQDKLERRPWVAFPLESVRRFSKIDGKHLALVIAMNLFVAVIPLIIISYAFIEAFNPHRDVGTLIAGNLHLTGSTARIVKNTFTNASSGKSVALGISVISLLITGLDVSATAQIAYARAFTMTPLRGIQKYLRGGAWLILLLADTGAALTLRSLATQRRPGAGVERIPSLLTGPYRASRFLFQHRARSGRGRFGPCGARGLRGSRGCRKGAARTARPRPRR
jgi:uncharacterized BrkB/YihY/UPF0761 family membrane protein